MYTNDDARFDAEQQGRCALCGRELTDCHHCDVCGKRNCTTPHGDAMPTYRTFKRSARNFEEFASAEKIEVETGLSYSEARDQCKEFNDNRTTAQEEAGTKMEFEED